MAEALTIAVIKTGTDRPAANGCVRRAGGADLFVALRKYSIRLQLLVIGAIILLLLSGAVVWSYYQIRSMTYKRNSDYTTELIATIKQNVAVNADSVNRILPNIAFNDQVQRYLAETDKLAQFELYAGIESLLVNLQSMKQGIVGIVLVSTVGGGFYNCVNCESYIPFDEFPERTSAYYTGVHRYLLAGPARYVVYVGTPVYDKRGIAPGGAKIGYAVIVLDANTLAPQIGSMSDRIAGSFYVLDRYGAVATSNDADTVGKPFSKLDGPVPDSFGDKAASPSEFRKDGTKYIVHAEPIPEIGGRVVSVFPVSELFRGLEDVQRLVAGMFIVLIAVMYAFYIAISRNILHPIRSFMTFVYRLRTKGLDQMNARVKLDGYAEISIMARQFNALLDEIDELAAKLIDSKTHIFELQLLKKQAELQYLKSQINPHFLYNTLETIKGIAHVKGVPEIRDMTDALSRIFRYSVKGDEFVLLRDEIRTVEAYIRIQQIRFDGRFEVEYRLDPESLDCKVIKMMLQPLVENAVFHGIEPSLHRCRLTIDCKIDPAGHLRIAIEDDGVGMEAETLARIRAELEDGPQASGDVAASPHRHVGMINVNSRIRFAYGSEYGIVSVESAPDRGTRVTVRIPAGGERYA